jgi:uncharacterized membrane protein YdjX (TVP38/TMEM64 family)
MVPRAAIAAVAGAMFGAAYGAAYTPLGSMLGPTVAFGIGRHLGRPYLLHLAGRRNAPHRAVLVDEWVIRQVSGSATELARRVLAPRR